MSYAVAFRLGELTGVPDTPWSAEGNFACSCSWARWRAAVSPAIRPAHPEKPKEPRQSRATSWILPKPDPPRPTLSSADGVH